MIHWWEQSGIIACNWDNGWRAFDDGQALGVAIVGELRRKGIPLQRIGRLKLQPISGEYLVTDGRRVLWAAHPETLIARVAAAPGGCYVISIQDLQTRLNGDERRRKA
jgi:hypothetical protein